MFSKLNNVFKQLKIATTAYFESRIEKKDLEELKRAKEWVFHYYYGEGGDISLLEQHYLPCSLQEIDPCPFNVGVMEAIKTIRLREEKSS